MNYMDPSNIIICNLRNTNYDPIEDYHILVDRTNDLLGNPYYMYDESKRDEVCEKYINMEKSEEYWKEIEELKNVYLRQGTLWLFCWCAPKRCHAEYIKERILLAVKKDEDDNLILHRNAVNSP